jgi:1-acyl-sn-glycerol-3-phosphate acyltransferase
VKNQREDRAEMVYWRYGSPPSALDLARNGVSTNVARIVVQVLVRAYLGLFHGVRARDGRRLRHLRGHLVVANHASHLDALVLLSSFPLRRVNGVRALCAKDYFLRHPWRHWLAFLLANTIPMARDRFDRRALSFCREELRRGANLIVFPEGTRSRDGRMARFKGGVGLLALTGGLPVLPAGIDGTYECWPKGRALPHPGAIRVAFGETVRYAGSGRGKQNWLLVAADLQRRVGRLVLRARKESMDHEHAATDGLEGAGRHVGPAERRRPHRPRARAHVGHDAGLRLPQPPLRQAVGG